LRAGLAAVLATGGRHRRSPERLHAAPLALMERQQPCDVTPLLQEQSPLNEHADDGLALSFFAYLVDVAGLPALRTFLTQFDPQQPDRAAAGAYNQPVAALQDQWLASVAELGDEHVSIRAFLSRLLPYARPYPR